MYYLTNYENGDEIRKKAEWSFIYVGPFGHVCHPVSKRTCDVFVYSIPTPPTKHQQCIRRRTIITTQNGSEKQQGRDRRSGIPSFSFLWLLFILKSLIVPYYPSLAWNTRWRGCSLFYEQPPPTQPICQTRKTCWWAFFTFHLLPHLLTPQTCKTRPSGHVSCVRCIFHSTHCLEHQLHLPPHPLNLSACFMFPHLLIPLNT